MRYAGYPVTAAHADVDSGAEILAAGGSGNRLVGDVTGCSFGYQPGTATRSALLTARLALTRRGESVTLLEQVAMGNPP